MKTDAYDEPPKDYDNVTEASKSKVNQVLNYINGVSKQVPSFRGMKIENNPSEQSGEYAWIKKKPARL